VNLNALPAPILKIALDEKMDTLRDRVKSHRDQHPSAVVIGTGSAKDLKFVSAILA